MALVRARWVVPVLASDLLLGDGSAAGAQDGSGESRHQFFPDSGYFRPLVAHMKEPGSYGGFRSVDFDERDGGAEGLGVELFASTFSRHTRFPSPACARRCRARPGAVLFSGID